MYALLTPQYKRLHKFTLTDMECTAKQISRYIGTLKRLCNTHMHVIVHTYACTNRHMPVL